MLFGGKGKPENVTPDALISLLNTSFDKKLVSLKEKNKSNVRELHSVRLQFIRACEEFERLNVEPYTEDLYVANTSFIKTQKSLYAQTLKRLANELLLSSENAANTYEECATVTSNVEDTLNKIFKTNATYKQVLHCYSNYLGGFKRTFSAIERLAKLARGELDKKSTEFSEYKNVREAISGLDQLDMELETLQKNISIGGLEKAQAQTSSDPLSERERSASGKMEAKRTELKKASEEILALRNKINALAAPLERAARKFDHISVRERQLHEFIEDPIGASPTEADYKEMMLLVKELGSSVSSGAIDVKNKDEVTKVASGLLSSSLYSMISTSHLLQQRRQELENEIRSLEMALGYLKEDEMILERSTRYAEEMRRKAGELESQMNSAKSRIERLFSDYYGKTVLIAL